MMDVYSNELGREGEARETFTNNALLVKTSNENYAETLKKVREEIELCGKKVELKKIRTTRGGDMIIELKEGESGKDLQEMIRKGNRGIETRLLDKDFRKRKKYVMKDLDAVTRKEEVETNLRETAMTQDEKEAVKVISLREAYGRTQTAIIQLDKDHGERINREGGIGICLIKVRLKEWIVIDRCYRCWETGHKADSCKGPDRSKACLKCGKADGHSARDCINEVACPLCQREGHGAGSGACPRMRNMLEKVRNAGGRRGGGRT